MKNDSNDTLFDWYKLNKNLSIKKTRRNNDCSSMATNKFKCIFVRLQRRLLFKDSVLVGWLTRKTRKTRLTCDKKI
jgi:hypothetical protein